MFRQILTGAFVLGVASAAAAQSPMPQGAAPAPVAAEPVPDAFAQATAARVVADFARRQKDPQAMIVAARMLADVPITSGADDSGFSPASLFAEARALAGPNPVLLQQIRIAQSTAPRGVTSSPFGHGLLRNVQLLAPRSTYQFTITAKGGAPLQIGAIGDLGTNLTMRLSDAAGHVVCLDDHGDYAPVCELRPRATSAYHVNLLNKSGTESRTVILSN